MSFETFNLHGRNAVGTKEIGQGFQCFPNLSLPFELGRRLENEDFQIPVISPRGHTVDSFDYLWLDDKNDEALMFQFKEYRFGVMLSSSGNMYLVLYENLQNHWYLCKYGFAINLSSGNTDNCCYPACSVEYVLNESEGMYQPIIILLENAPNPQFVKDSVREVEVIMNDIVKNGRLM